MINNIEKSKIFELKNEVEYIDNEINIKTLSHNDNHRLKLLALDKGKEMASHEAAGDALVYVLDGKVEITIDGKAYLLQAGQSVIMPAKTPHALKATERFKMLLTVLIN